MTRLRGRLETIGAALALFLATLTLIVPDWLEAFGFDPDQHSGWVEWSLAGGFACAAAVLAGLGLRNRRRALQATAR